MSVPLCVNCKWMEIVLTVCGHEKAPRSLVDGQPDTPCYLMRSAHPQTNACGPDGDWFEAQDA